MPACSCSAPLSALAALAPLLRSIGWSHATLQRAKIGGGGEGGEGGDGVEGSASAGAYAGWVEAHAARWLPLAAACDACVEAAAAAAEEEEAAAEGAERARMAAATTRSLLYAWVDDEAGVAGLRGGEAVQAARERLEALEPGFLGR